MRLFLGVAIPPSLREKLTEVGTQARGEAVKAGLKARWIPAKNFHVTLCFLGEIDPQALPPFHNATEQICAATPPLTLSLTSCGVFPPRGKARVLWAGLDASDAFFDLQTSIAEAAEEHLGVAREKRPYHPHLTLAYCKPPWPRSAADRLTEHSVLDLDRISDPFEVRETVLFESKLGSAGPDYRGVRAYPFR